MQLNFNLEINDDTPLILLNQTKKSEELKEIPACYVITDVETTGLNPYKDSIIELCALKIADNKIIDEFSTIIKPDKIIPDFIVNLTGITNLMACNGQEPRKALIDYCNFISTFPIVGHNIKFDLSFINSALEKEFKQKLKNDYIDTLFFSKKIYTNLSSHKLTNIANYLNIDTKNAHRAFIDCRITYDIIQDIKKKTQQEG